MPNIPAKIACVYALSGTLLVVLSEWLLHILVSDPALVSLFHTVDGGVFIAVTTAVLYRMVARDHAELKRSSDAVREREALLKNVLEALPVGVWLLDRGGEITYANPAGRKIWEGTSFVASDQFLDYKGWWLATGKRFEAEEWGGARAIRMGETSLDEEIEIERFDGVHGIILHSAIPLRNQQDDIVGAVVVNEDITSRKRMEESLLEQERIYRELFENNPQPMWVHAVETLEFIAVNDAAVDHYGYSRREFLQMRVRDICLPDDVSVLTATDGKYRGKRAKAGYWQQRKKDSSLIDVEITINDMQFNGRAARLVLINDITERRRVERELADYQEELRFLASEIVLIEERERRQLATTLHDQVGQVLALAKIKLGILKAAGSAEECRREADEIRELLDQAICSSRSLTFEISPPILYDLGFEAAVQALCEKFQQQHGLRLTFDSDRDTRPLPEDMRILLFQAVRELLVNIVKHARAGSAQVSCRSGKDQIVIVVADDGSGFDPSPTFTRLPGTRGFGLFSIRERLYLLGGELTIDSTPGGGTRITLVAPLHESLAEGTTL